MKQATKRATSTARPSVVTIESDSVTKQLDWASSLAEILRSRTVADTVERHIADNLQSLLLSVTEKVDDLVAAQGKVAV